MMVWKRWLIATCAYFLFLFFIAYEIVFRLVNMYLLAILSSFLCLLFLSNIINGEPNIFTLSDDQFDSNEDFPPEQFVRRAPSAFLRFGRQSSPIVAPLASASFLRFGRGNTNAAGFLRFGRQIPSTGSNTFLRFGRRNAV